MKSKKQRGVVAVEVALILPLLLTILFAITQFAWLIGNYIVLTEAAAAGARQLASERGYSTPYTDTKNAVLAAAGTLKNALVINTSVGGTACSTDAGCQLSLGTMNNAPSPGSNVNVSLTYTFSPLFSGSLGGLSNAVPSSLNASMSEVIQ